MPHLYDRIEAPFLDPLRCHSINGLGRREILRWVAARALVQLVRGDAEEDLKALVKQFACIRGPIMITAANVIPGGTRIDPAKSQLADAFVAEVLGDRQSFMAISAQQ